MSDLRGFYRVGAHHGITICVEGDGQVCDLPGHDCARGHLVAVITNGDRDLAERICRGLNRFSGTVDVEFDRPDDLRENRQAPTEDDVVDPEVVRPGWAPVKGLNSI